MIRRGRVYLLFDDDDIYPLSAVAPTPPTPPTPTPTPVEDEGDAYVPRRRRRHREEPERRPQRRLRQLVPIGGRASARTEARGDLAAAVGLEGVAAAVSSARAALTTVPPFAPVRVLARQQARGKVGAIPALRLEEAAQTSEARAKVRSTVPISGSALSLTAGAFRWQRYNEAEALALLGVGTDPLRVLVA